MNGNPGGATDGEGKFPDADDALIRADFLWIYRICREPGTYFGMLR
jgi:hypothetical protein